MHDTGALHSDGRYSYKILKSFNLYINVVKSNEVLNTGSIEPVSGSVHRLRHGFVNSFTPPVRTNQVRFERAVGEGRVGWGRTSVQPEVDTNDSNVESRKPGAFTEERSLGVQTGAAYME